MDPPIITRPVLPVLVLFTWVLKCTGDSSVEDLLLNVCCAMYLEPIELFRPLFPNTCSGVFYGTNHQSILVIKLGVDIRSFEINILPSLINRYEGSANADSDQRKLCSGGRGEERIGAKGATSCVTDAAEDLTLLDDTVPSKLCVEPCAEEAVEARSGFATGNGGDDVVLTFGRETADFVMLGGNSNESCGLSPVRRVGARNRRTRDVDVDVGRVDRVVKIETNSEVTDA